MLYSRRAFIAVEYPDHVEAGFGEIRFFGQVLLCDGAYSCLFAGRDGFEGIPVSYTPTQLYFNEDEGFLLAEDKVDLPAAPPVVPCDQGIASALQIAQRQLLATVPGSFSAQTTTPA